MNTNPDQEVTMNAPTVTTAVEKVTVPAGRYYVGDPCYPFPNEGPYADQWMSLLESCNYFEDTPVGTVTVDGATFHVVSFGTAHGDGGYVGSDGFEYSVDAGMIGLVPMDLVERFAVDPEYIARLGTVVEFPSAFTAKERDGKITLGHITIDTDDEDEGWG